MSDKPLSSQLCRCWLFLPAGDPLKNLLAAAESPADALIAEFEDFTAPEKRPAARAQLSKVIQAWRAAGKRTAARINPLSDADGLRDLEAAMAAGVDVVALPKVSMPGHVTQLGEAVGAQERKLGRPIGSTELLPNIESAAGLVRTIDIVTASPRVEAALVASEDMANDLQCERGRDGSELRYVRERFLVECRAAGIQPIDCPYTWTDLEGVAADSAYARRLGYTSKSAVSLEHAMTIQAALTPGAEAIEQARLKVRAFEAARQRGEGRVEVAGSLVEMPIYAEAQRLLKRAALYGLLNDDDQEE